MKDPFFKAKLSAFRSILSDVEPVSYTHLDVYKRQIYTTHINNTRPPPTTRLAPGHGLKGWLISLWLEWGVSSITAGGHNRSMN